MPNIHTVRPGGQWVNREEGTKTALSSHATKERAVEGGRERARRAQTEHIIHDQDGTISERHSYGNDPRWREG
jgi:hypothetical protein